MMSFNKKASLEISIQAIVIVVLAMTLLGLGLGFIKGMFKDISETTTGVTSTIQEQILEDLRTGDKKISFPSSEITIGRGDDQVLGIGIKNQKGNTLYYKIRFTPISGPSSGGGSTQLNPTDLDNWFQGGTRQIFALQPVDSEVRGVRLQIPKSTPPGSYFLTFDVLECESDTDCANFLTYAQKDVFIVVTG